MEYTSGKVLATMMDEQRNLTRFYLSKLKGEDMYREFEVNGYTTNSPYWILAHMCWAENMVAIQCLGGKGVDVPWVLIWSTSSGFKPAFSKQFFITAITPMPSGCGAVIW